MFWFSISKRNLSKEFILENKDKLYLPLLQINNKEEIYEIYSDKDIQKMKEEMKYLNLVDLELLYFDYSISKNMINKEKYIEYMCEYIELNDYIVNKYLEYFTLNNTIIELACENIGLSEEMINKLLTYKK